MKYLIFDVCLLPKFDDKNNTAWCFCFLPCGGQAYFYALGKSLASTANVIVVNHHPNWVLDDYERGGSSGARRDRVGGRFSFFVECTRECTRECQRAWFRIFFLRVVLIPTLIQYCHCFRKRWSTAKATGAHAKRFGVFDGKGIVHFAVCLQEWMYLILCTCLCACVHVACVHVCVLCSCVHVLVQHSRCSILTLFVPCSSTTAFTGHSVERQSEIEAGGRRAQLHAPCTRCNKPRRPERNRRSQVCIPCSMCSFLLVLSQDSLATQNRKGLIIIDRQPLLFFELIFLVEHLTLTLCVGHAGPPFHRCW